GLALSCVVHPANVQDRDTARWVLARATFDFARLRIIRADAGYAGRLERWVRTSCHWSLEIIRRTSKGFVVLPKRWVVERTPNKKTHGLSPVGFGGGNGARRVLCGGGAVSREEIGLAADDLFRDEVLASAFLLG
ncbi:MAG: transposase, partial [Planctomycetaceae bacterium]|nr:transposase [Planctomycetaceae bacterium]